MENTEMLLMMMNEKINPSFDDSWVVSYEDLFDALEDLPMVVFDANGQLLPQSNSSIDHHRIHNDSWADIFGQEAMTTLPISDHTSGSISELVVVDDTNMVISSSSPSPAHRKLSEKRPRAFSKKKGSSGTTSRTKFINADRDNFKDVVQHYTGCDIALLAKKRPSTGPVMLCFDQVTYHQLEAGSTVAAAPIRNSQ